MVADFTECVIIPLSTYNEKCKEGKNALGKDWRLLYDDSVPSDVKIKLFNQSQKLRAPPPQPKQLATARRTSSILENISPERKKFAEGILLRIARHPNFITWNEKLEVVINQEPIPQSDFYCAASIHCRRQKRPPYGSPPVFSGFKRTRGAFKLDEVEEKAGWVRLDQCILIKRKWQQLHVVIFTLLCFRM